MKKILLASATIAAFGLAAPAFAQDTTAPQSADFQINAENPAKCQINADQTTVTLADDSISNEQGRARGNIGQQVAQGLDALNARAWCTGARNSVNLTRSPLTTGNGEPVDGFNQAVIYDIAVDLNDAERVTGAKPIEGSADGPGQGPGVGGGAADPVGHFGPTGMGSRLRFSNEVGSTSNATINGDGEDARTAYPSDNARLTAGDYAGTVTLTITPGD